MLKIENLHVYYGGIHALNGISFHVPQGKIVTLLGANGAGKSTTLRTITRLVKPSEGKILFKGEDISQAKTADIVKKGVSLVPEGRRVFSNLTVKENLVLGAYSRNNQDEIQKDMDWVFDLFPRLKEREWQAAGTLSGGEQQMLAIARGLMSRPSLMMMDEPSLGLAPIIVRDVFKIIKEIHSMGVTILLIEQNARAALQVADYAYVMETGNIVLEGTGQELSAHDEVRKAYLGE